MSEENKPDWCPQEVCEDQSKAFLSHSFSERFACDLCAASIRRPS